MGHSSLLSPQNSWSQEPVSKGSHALVRLRRALVMTRARETQRWCPREPRGHACLSLPVATAFPPQFSTSGSSLWARLRAALLGPRLFLKGQEGGSNGLCCASLTRRAGHGGGRGPEPLARPSGVACGPQNLSLSAHLSNEADPAPAPKIAQRIKCSDTSSPQDGHTHTRDSVLAAVTFRKTMAGQPMLLRQSPWTALSLPLGSRAPANE